MTNPIDGDDGRDDEFDWEREGEAPSTREQLARLRDGLARSGGSRRRGSRDERDPGTPDLPGSLDRAIARVGGLLDDVGPASTKGVRDPYADFGEEAPRAADEDRYAEPYQDPYAAPDAEDAYEDRGAPARRERASRAEPGYGRGGYQDGEEERDARGGRRASPDRRERREARSRKSDFSYDDSIAEPSPPPQRRKRAKETRYRDAQADDLRRERLQDQAAFDRPEADERGDARWGDAPAEPSRRGRRGDRGYDARAPEPAAEAPVRERPARKSKARKSRGDSVMDPEAAAAEAEATRGRGSAPFGALERMLAGRYLRARRKEGFISVIAMLSLLGITLAVAVLIVVMSVMNGFRTEFVSKIVGVDGHMTVLPFERSQSSFEETARKIRAVPGVSRAAPMIKGQAFATSRYGGLGVLVRGMSKPDLLGVDKVSVSPERSAGSLANYGAGDGIAIGEGLANKLGVGVGDTLNVISPQGSVTPFGVAPKRRVFEVIYVFKIGISWYDNALIFMPLKDAQSFFSRPGGADVIDVQVATPDQLDGYAEDIRDTAGGDVSIRTWMDENGTMIGALKTEQSVMFLILSMLILIASLIIISGLIMLVQEKGPDIAILRTMGLSRGGVMRVFFMCGATIGLIGVIVGVTLGVLVALNISDIKEFIEAATGRQLFPEEVYLFSKLPSRLDWNDVGFTVLITLSLSFVATLYPAWRAASMDPVEALRYE